MTNYKHLCKEQRNTIEYLLNKGYNFTYIGNAINVDRTTIAKEIKRNRFLKNSCFLPFNKTGINKAINNCEKLSKPPYCCNNCEHKSFCIKSHLYYNAKEAQKHYEDDLIKSRKGIDITQEEIDIINKNIVPLVKDKHQSINQIYINHPDILYFSKPTFYKYVNEGVILLNNLDLPRKVKYKKRKSNKSKENKRDLLILRNRRYEDYLLRIEKNKKLNIWLLDTVIGKNDDDKCLMTFLLLETNFMFIRLLNKKNVINVNNEFDKLKMTLGIDVYKEFINVILTDNGSEFFDPIHIEINPKTGEKISSVYYCKPNSPEQKAELEKNHEYIRYIFPKSTSFNNLTPALVQKLEDTINNIPREILGNKSPYELTKEKYPLLISKSDSSYIEPDEVSLNPKDILMKR